MKSENLKKQLDELEANLKDTYENLDFKISMNEHNLYNSYSITYSYRE